MEIRSESSFVRGLQIQRRVLYALMMRELITRFGRENLGVLWLVGEPVLFTIGIASLWSASMAIHGNSAIPIVAFAVTGYSSVLVWRNATNRCNLAMEQNKNLLFHRRVQAIDVFLTRIALEIVGAGASFLILSSIFIYLGWMSPPNDIGLVVLGWLMLAWYGTSLALLIGGGTAFSHVVERLWHPISYLLFPLSGAAFMVDWLPAGLRKFVLLLPMVNGVEVLREGFFGNLVQAHYDIEYMAMCCLVQTLAGLLVVREAGRRIEF